MDPELPGADLIARGLSDLRQGRDSIEALLVRIGRPRLERLHIDIPQCAQDETSPELQLYHHLAAESGNDAHGRYNALIRRLVSFEQALERANRRERAGQSTS